MAEKPAKNDKAAGKGAPAPADGAAPAGKKKLPIKTIAIVAVCLLVEGVAISGVFMLSGKPHDANAKVDHAAADLAADQEKPVELSVITDKFQNTRSGRTYLYDTEIFVVVKTKNKVKVEAQLKATAAQINNDITMIFRAAEPAHLLEPTLATLNRQIRAALDERVGKDTVEGKPLIDEVVIKKFIQFRAE